MDMIYWDHYYNSILLLNLLIVVVLFTSLRLFSGIIAHIKASDELLKKDNPAFGVSLAGATLGITIMLSGTMYGSPENNAIYSIISVGVFGVVGIGLLALTRVIFDKITLPDIHLRDEIIRGNMAVAIADAGNVLATALIIRIVLIWVTTNSFEGFFAILSGYAVSQFILTSMTLGRRAAFSFIHKGNNLQDELKKGNIAVALRFAGQKIGTAFAIALAAQIVVYEEYDILTILCAWFVASIIVVLVWKFLSFIAAKIILFRVNVNEEVVVQKNIAVGALQAVIYIAMGLLISAL